MLSFGRVQLFFTSLRLLAVSELHPARKELRCKTGLLIRHIACAWRACTVGRLVASFHTGRCSMDTAVAPHAHVSTLAYDR